mmetsp:Transcript_16109/g.41007  ORF Transcript_16109/g.41007 Transcript_16109/m.41007 type:complete len:546 (+) Transcript_16109:47-1684(+)
MRGSLAVLCAAGASQPNFLVLFADDMRYGDLSAHGHPTASTPRLDRLASEGMRFTQWYSGFHVCSPSRASMMTGRLPIRSGLAGSGWTGGVFGNRAVGGLPTNETTIASMLGKQGYATLAVGKWHLGQRTEFLPVSHGFDEYYGIPYSDDMGSSPWRKANDLVLPLLHNSTVVEQPADLSTITERYTEKAVDFMKRNTAASKPWFLYLAWNHVHIPDFASKQFCNSSIRGRFGDALAEMDFHAGQVLDGLEEAGASNNTVVFFTSDNGPWLIQRWAAGHAGHFFEGKTTTWEGGVRVPGIIRWPGRVPAGVVSHEIVATYDIFPTVAKLSGATLPGVALDGVDLSQVMLGNATTREDRCIMLYKGTPSRGIPVHPDDPQPGLWAVRCGPYKAHFVTSCAVMGALGDKRCVGSYDVGECHGSECDEKLLAMQGATAVHHDPPMMFQVEKDPGELYPLDPKSAAYKGALSKILAAKKAHEDSLVPVPNQMSQGVSKHHGKCCDPESQKKYPTYQNCTCNPEVWDKAFVCTPVDDSPSNHWSEHRGLV